MSLDFKLNNIEGSEYICYNEKNEMNPVTKILIFLTMTIGLNKITSRNYKKFHNRIRMSESVYGQFLVNNNIDLKEVEKHIGLTTNATPLSKSKFLNNLGRHFNI